MRNTNLLHEIADVMEFSPKRYNQSSWGEFIPDEAARERFVESHGRQPDGTLDGVEDYGWIHADVGCGTALCVAGHAAALSGWFPTIFPRPNGREEVRWSSVSETPNSYYLTHRNPDGVVVRDVSVLAQELLGLNEVEAEILFRSTNVWTVQEMRAFAAGADIGDRGDDVE